MLGTAGASFPTCLHRSGQLTGEVARADGLRTTGAAMADGANVSGSYRLMSAMPLRDFRGCGRNSIVGRRSVTSWHSSPNRCSWKNAAPSLPALMIPSCGSGACSPSPWLRRTCSHSAQQQQASRSVRPTVGLARWTSWRSLGPSAPLQGAVIAPRDATKAWQRRLWTYGTGRFALTAWNCVVSSNEHVIKPQLIMTEFKKA